MGWIILATLFVLGIAFYQSVQGIYSALIMALGTVVCVCLAFNYYEPLSAMIAPGKPQFGNASALMLLLFVPLMAYRFVVDRYLPGNLIPGALLDRIGGAAFGLVTALLLTGMLQLSMQMLPFERNTLGYDAYDNALTPNSKFPYADSFTTGLVKTLSRGSLSAIGADPNGSESFGYHHGNLRLELWALRNRTDRTSLHPGTETMRVDSIYDVTDAYNDDIAAYPGFEGEPSRVLAVRVDVPDDAQEKGTFFLSGTHFRLVDANGQSFFPMGYLRNAGQWEAVTSDDAPGDLQLRFSADQNVGFVDMLFRIPNEPGATNRELAFLAFRGSRLSPIPDLPGPDEATHPPSIGSLGGRQATGRIRFSDERPIYLFRPEEVSVKEDLPLSIRVEQGGTADQPAQFDSPVMSVVVIDRTFASGQVQGPSSEFDVGQINVGEFNIPAGYRMVQVVGQGPTSGMLPNLGAIALDPRAEVRIPKGSGTAPASVPAVGAWVRWSERVPGRRGPVQAMHLTYTPDLDVATANEQAEDYITRSRAIANDILGVGRTLAQHNGQGVQVGVIFLLPENAAFQGLRLGNATIRPESSLSVGSN